jgi:hypothetical protein
MRLSSSRRRRSYDTPSFADTAADYEHRATL